MITVIINLYIRDLEKKRVLVTQANENQRTDFSSRIFKERFIFCGNNKLKHF